MKKIPILLFLMFSVLNINVFAQVATNLKALQSAEVLLKTSTAANMQKAYSLAKTKHWDLVKTTKKGTAYLMGVTNFNHPIYYSTYDNIIAATTVGANLLWPGGISGLNLDASSDSLTNKMAIWDGGGVLATHVELAGRITQVDGAQVNATGGSAHATHVTGTLMATGINPLAKGMSNRLKGLLAYDFENDNREMAGAAPGLLLSNHSYGTVCGWYEDTDGSWIFEGQQGDTADYNFGNYNADAATWDNIAYNAPYYLIVKAAGNNRNVNGPAVGQPYFYYDANGNEIQAIRPAGISSNDGYGIIPTAGNAKNIITVGAVNPIPTGYSSPADVVMTPFSSWGPTNDGRIKPDLVADGLNVLSLTSTGNSDYMIESGTSMSTPNITGSLLLLQQYYNQLHGSSFMRSATLKGLAIHTADEAGSFPGPDYIFGWGLLNVKKAADVITAAVPSNNSATSPHLIYEKVLNNGQTDTIHVIASGKTALTATLSWTDPAGIVETVNILNNPTPMLVNDLDLRIIKDSSIYYPWVLAPPTPAAAATKGDNHLDNAEKVELDSVVPGQVYTIQVSHKGTLSGGLQAYSLLVSGVGGSVYCIPTDTISSGASIDSVAFGGINNKKTTGCASYNNFSAQTPTASPSQTLPITINLSSCDGLAHTKNVNVYIDYNNNGSFSDSGELVAKGSVTGIVSTFSTKITIPYWVTIGSNTLMRIVAADTSAAILNPCVTYTNGETQDYGLTFTKPNYDIALTNIITPLMGDYPCSSQLLAVTISNLGLDTLQNIALSATIKQGNTIPATLWGNYPSPIAGAARATYTFQAPFITLPDSIYTITVAATAPIDYNPSNNTLTQKITIAPTLATSANTCNGTTNVSVKNPVSSTAYSWYNSTAATNPFDTGATATASLPANDSIVYLSGGSRANVGLAAKGSALGGYEYGSNYLNYNSNFPVVLESARLYTDFPGTVTIMAADVYDTSATGYNYQVLNSTNINVYATNPAPMSGSVDGNNRADTGDVFYINLALPAGSHSIVVTSSDATLFRSNGLNRGATYPYNIPYIFSLTGNGAVSSDQSDTTYYYSLYYYLYNMKIKTQDCVGDRLPVPIYISPTPQVSFVNDTLISSAATGNQWYLDGLAIAGAIGNTYKPLTYSGAYTVVATDSFSCAKKSPPFYIDRVVPDVYPNPTKGDFNVRFYVNTPTNLALSLVGSTGKQLFTKSYSNYQGSFLEHISASSLASGVYILEVQHGGSIEHKKLIIAH